MPKQLKNIPSFNKFVNENKLKSSDWIKLSDKMPTVSANGYAVLVYRIPVPNQRANAITVYLTEMIKHCDKNETWWMQLPEEPEY